MPIDVKKFMLLEDQHFNLGFSDELTDKRPRIAETIPNLSDEITDFTDHWNRELDTQKASEGVDAAQQVTNQVVTPAVAGVDAAQEDEAGHAKADGTKDPQKGSDELESKQQPNWFVRIWRAILNFFNRLFKPKSTTNEAKPMRSDNISENAGTRMDTPAHDLREGEPPSPGP